MLQLEIRLAIFENAPLKIMAAEDLRDLREIWPSR